MMLEDYGSSGETPFVDPRAGKTNLIGARSSAEVSFGAAITGPDGAASGVRVTSTGAQGRVAWGPLTTYAGQTLTISMYVRTPSDQAVKFFLGSGAAAPTSTVMDIGYYAGWTLVEVQYTSPTPLTLYMWLGSGSSFSTGEWVEYALPMVYEGNKVT